MASSWYSWGKAELARGNIDWVNDDIRIATLTSAYTFDDTDQDMADIVSGIVSQSAASISTKTVSNDGILDGADPHTHSSVAAGSTINALVFYLHAAGVAANQTLLFYVDQGTGFPFPTNGSDIDITFDNGTNKITKL